MARLWSHFRARERVYSTQNSEKHDLHGEVQRNGQCTRKFQLKFPVNIYLRSQQHDIHCAHTHRVDSKQNSLYIIFSLIKCDFTRYVAFVFWKLVWQICAFLIRNLILSISAHCDIKDFMNKTVEVFYSSFLVAHQAELIRTLNMFVKSSTNPIVPIWTSKFFLNQSTGALLDRKSGTLWDVWVVWMRRSVRK